MAGDEIGTTRTLPPALSPDGAVVTVLSGQAKGTLVRVPGAIGEALIVGKSSTSDLVLPDETVSRKHVEIRRTERGVTVRDLDSTNGVRIGGALVKEALVELGTVVRAGDVELLIGIELEDVVIAPSPNDQFGLAYGGSFAMRRIFGVLERIAASHASVLLTGETGTGKDVLARSIHMRSTRADGPFEVLDCGAVAPTIIESELFGHERGAFTGAVSSRAGAFERASGGTLFLDEIGELAPELQPKLLRVLESREFRRVGGDKMLTADVRVIAATTRKLAVEARRGTFRDDLYYRLAVVTLDVPPLRAHAEDIPLLATKLLESAGATPERAVLDEATATALRSYEWPGNVRELRNVLDRALHLSTASGTAKLRLVDFPPNVEATDDLEHDSFSFDDAMSYREVRARHDALFEHRYVRWLLERHGGNVAAAARAARMDRNHLTDLASKYGLERRRRTKR